MGSGEVEADHGGLSGGRSVKNDAVDFRQQLGAVLQQGVLVLGNGVQPYPMHPPRRFGQSNGPGNVRGAGFKLKGQSCVGGAFQMHLVDHLPASHIGRQAFQPFGFSVKHANAGGAVHFVAAEGVKIDVQVLHVHAAVRHGLGAIHKNGRSHCVGGGGHFLHRIDGSQGIGYVVEGHQLDGRIQQSGIRLGVQRSVVLHGDKT